MANLEKEFTSYFEQCGIDQGLDASTAKIAAMLYLQPTEISMEEVANKSGYSLASVSNKIAALSLGGMIRRTTRPGSKKIYLFMEKDYLGATRRILLKKQEALITMGKEKLPVIIKEYKSKARTEDERKKAKIMEDYYDQLKKSEIIIKSMIDLLNK